MAFENIPTPAQMASNWYDMSSGNCLDCTPEQREHPAYKQWFLGMLSILKDTPPINGVPQIKYVNIFKAAGAPDNPVAMECYERANQLALANPAWGKKAGQDGLLKVAIACMWEAQGRIPDGYMQGLVTELGKKSAIDPKWLWIGGAAVGAWLLLRK
jgi:hypothetical protein